MEPPDPFQPITFFLSHRLWPFCKKKCSNNKTLKCEWITKEHFWCWLTTQNGSLITFNSKFLKTWSKVSVYRKFFLMNSGLVKDCIGAHSCHGWPVTQVKLIETQLSLIIWRMPDHMLTESMSDSMICNKAVWKTAIAQLATACASL